MDWLNKRVSSSLARNLGSAYAELKRVSSALKLPESIESESMRIYTASVQKNIMRGRSMDAILAASVYAATRINGLPRSLDEISRNTSSNILDIRRTYKVLLKKLGLKVTLCSANDYLPRFISMLKLSNDTLTKSMDIITRSEDKNILSGKNPVTVAAAAIYFAALITGERRNQKTIAETLGITEVSLRCRGMEIFKTLNLEKEFKKVRVK